VTGSLPEAGSGEGLPAWLEATLGPGDHREVVAIGWATVDFERTAGELGGAWQAAPAERLLGGRAWIRLGLAGPNDGDVGIILLEPSTEGRLAAALARQGEGPVAVYRRPAADPGTDRRTRAGDGPLGRQQLELDGPVAGPFRLTLVEAERVPSEP
jgi:hypothetical protein